MSPTFTFVFPVVQWFKQSTTILQTDWYKPINLVNSICLYNITLCTVSWGGRRTLCSQLCLHVIWNIQQLCCWQYLNTFPFLSCFKHTERIIEYLQILNRCSVSGETKLRDCWGVSQTWSRSTQYYLGKGLISIRLRGYNTIQNMYKMLEVCDEFLWLLHVFTYV